MKTWLRLWKLKRQLYKVDRAHKTFQQSQKYKDLKREDREGEDQAFFQVDYAPIWEEIQEIQTRRFLSKLQSYNVPYHSKWDKEGEKLWDTGGFGNSYLTTEGYHQLRRLLREEQKARRDMILGWAVPVITAITGLLGSAIAVLTIIKYWNK